MKAKQKQGIIICSLSAINCTLHVTFCYWRLRQTECRGSVALQQAEKVCIFTVLSHPCGFFKRQMLQLHRWGLIQEVWGMPDNCIKRTYTLVHTTLIAVFILNGVDFSSCSLISVLLLICKMGTIIVPTTQSCWEDDADNSNRVLGAEPGRDTSSVSVSWWWCHCDGRHHHFCPGNLGLFSIPPFDNSLPNYLTYSPKSDEPRSSSGHL